MSQPNASTPPGADDVPLEADQDLQFDEVEYATPAPAGPTCGFCNQPMADVYYETGGKVFCENCRGRIEQAFRGGSGLVRLLRALVYGTAAAAAGGALYYAIIRLTDINFGLIAVLVGFMVGRAVKLGTGNRGGLLYQILAVFLTYSSIVAMHVPYLIEGFRNRPQKVEQADANPAKNDADRTKAKAPAGDAKPAEAPKVEAKADAPAPVPPASDPKQKIAPRKDKDGGDDNDAPPDVVELPSPGRFLFLIVVLIGFLYTIPVQVAISAPISGLIFGFALWEAWKITKKVQLLINGPFRVSTAVPEANDHGE